MTEVVSASCGVFAAGIDWFVAPSPNLRQEAQEIAASMGGARSGCVLVPASEVAPAHIGIGEMETAKSIGGPVAGAAALLDMAEPDLAVLVELDDGRWWTAGKIGNMIAIDCDAIHPTRSEAVDCLLRVQERAQAGITLIVDPEIDISGWPSRLPVGRFEEAIGSRRLARLQHMAAPTRILRTAVALLVGVALVPTAVYAGIVGLRPPDQVASLPPPGRSASAPRPAEAVEICYRGFARLLYQDGWSPVDFECVLDRSARRELGGAEGGWTGPYVAARYSQNSGSAVAFRDWAKAYLVTLNKSVAVAVHSLGPEELSAREPERLQSVGTVEAQLLDTGTRLGEPLEVRPRAGSGLAFDVSSTMPARHWARVLGVPGLRITRIGVAISGSQVRWSLSGEVDAL